MTHLKVTTGKVNPAVESLKRAISDLLPRLPIGWRRQFREWDELYKTAEGNGRLTKIKAGQVAPTLEELEFIKHMLNYPQSLNRQRLKLPK